MADPSPPAVNASTMLVAASSVALAVLLGVVALGANRKVACQAREAFLFDLCPARNEVTVTDRLRAHLAKNPGDTSAYRDLALADRTEEHNRIVSAALRLAPVQPQLLLHRAAAALDGGQTAAAVADLVQIANHHEIPLAAKSLARIIADGNGKLLEPYLAPGNQWLPRALAELRTGGRHFSRSLPLISVALKRSALDAATAREYLRELRAAGAWADAYGLWLAMLGKPVPVLFNGSFDDPFDADGFDWEVPQPAQSRRAGALADRRGFPERGGVLDVQFTGRPISLPIARQYLFIAPGSYRLRGEYLGRQFRAENGMLWSIYCGKERVASSPAIVDTGGNWRPLEFSFEIPPGCGLVASLQLDTATAADATLGARGRVTFDAFILERIR